MKNSVTILGNQLTGQVNLLVCGRSVTNVKAVLFDKDGTFIDSHVYWGGIIRKRADALCAQYKLATDLSDLIQISMGLDTKSGRLMPNGPIALQPREVVIQHVLECLEKLGVAASSSDIADLFVEVHKKFLIGIDQYITLINGFVDLAEKLRSYGVKIAVVTTDAVENTQSTLRYLNIEHLVDAVVGKESSTLPKETGMPALIALKMLDVEPCDAVCVGDAPMDVSMGTNAGCKATIGVTTGQVPAEILSAMTPFVVSSLADIGCEPVLVN